jgi:intracellular multiplication protein IcmX
MMKALRRSLLPSLLLTTAISTPVHADYDSGQLATYLKNLGLYFGYDITNPPPSDTSSGFSLLNLSAIQTPEQSLFETMLGAVPVNATSPSSMLFVPGTNSAYSSINGQANMTFTTPPYNTASQQAVSVNPLIDQQPYQQDPVTQAVLNILTTPDYTYCTNNDNNGWVDGCPLLSATKGGNPVMNENQVITNAIGTLQQQDGSSYFTYTYNQPFLNQLNSNSLIAPLLYTTTSDSTNTTSSGSSGAPQTNGSNGLTASNQAQQAANFIRYVTGAVAPLSLPKRQDYDKLFTAATTPGTDPTTTLAQKQAQATLASYFASLRIYAAQSSVGFGNLYYIFSKRAPQNTLGTDGTPSTNSQSSQALSEFTMATWRLFNPDQSAKTTWLSQINKASSATVEKEMVTLLAEINYQLYLNRQQEERLLLTNTLLLLQNARANQPTASSLAPANASNQ